MMKNTPTILVVDDEPGFLRWMQNSIEKLGYATEKAIGYEEALQKIITSDIDLVFLDLNLPDGDSVELAAKIRNKCPETDIVAMSGNSSRDMEIRIRKERIMCFLIKPFGVKELKSVTAHFLEGQTPRRTP